MLNKHRVACSRDAGDAFKFSNFKSLGLRESLRLSFADALRGLVQHNRSSSSEGQNSRNATHTASMPIDNKLQHHPFPPQPLSQEFWRCNRSSAEEVSSHLPLQALDRQRRQLGTSRNLTMVNHYFPRSELAIAEQPKNNPRPTQGSGVSSPP